MQHRASGLPEEDVPEDRDALTCNKEGPDEECYTCVKPIFAKLKACFSGWEND